MLWVSGCATTPSSAPTARADALKHPLDGRVWDVRQGRFTSLEEARTRAADSHFVLLGESHDHPQHHLLQAEFVRAIAEAGRRPVLAFEMLDVTQQTAADASLASAPRDAEALASAVGWARSGWPEFALYRPVFEAGLQSGLPIIAANLPPEQARAAVREGPQALDPSVRARIEQEGSYPPAVLDAMRHEMAVAHCGHLPEGMLEPLVLAQRARDVQMAQRLVQAATTDGAILIAGVGHVRADSGIPVILSKDAPDRSVLTVAFLETVSGLEQPGDYAKRWRGALPFDVVVFTPPLPREDPCERFRRRGL